MDWDKYRYRSYKKYRQFRIDTVFIKIDILYELYLPRYQKEGINIKVSTINTTSIPPNTLIGYRS